MDTYTKNETPLIPVKKAHSVKASTHTPTAVTSETTMPTKTGQPATAQ
jgi:hypothetical protein